MPKTEIDYSNTIIYKITCKDSNVKDVYVGHTTNFVQRKYAHKQSCINDKSPNYNCKLYEVIRNNGGWVNWKMEIINFFECYDHYEARKKEQEYFISLNATLNSIEPMPKPKPKEIVIKPDVIKETFFCEKCQYKCNKKSDYDKHLLTRKHIKDTKVGINTPNKIVQYKCNKYGVSVKHLSTLSRHKKKCFDNENVIIKNEPKNIIAQDTSNNDTIQLLLKENSDFKTMLMDMMKSNTDLVKSNTDLQKQMVEVCQQMRSQ